MSKKHPDRFCSLLIREFPAELAESCLSASSEKVLTRAVLHCLYDYFSLKKHYAALKIKKQDLESDLDQILHYWRLEQETKSCKEKVQKLLSDPNRFYLHGD